MSDSILYYGDNLDVLRQHIKDESVDLIYLDPPFNSNATYNVLFEEKNGSESAAQIKAFGDTWRWSQEAAQTFAEVIQRGERVAQLMLAFQSFLGHNDMLAYLTMMAPRLVELRRVLKLMGTIYLHCDPTASHYLKLLMDAVFGGESFRNEIIWQRAQPKSHMRIRFPSTHDVIFVYAKSPDAAFNPQFKPHDPKYIASHYSRVEPETGRRYALDNLLNPNKDRPNLTYEFPPNSGCVRVWRWTKERMMQAWADGRVVMPKEGGVPRYKRYLDEMPGEPLHDVWTDIPPINSQAKERLGYPTQKPEALLERIVEASSSKGDVVLDPFCGCGTAIAVAQRLKRQWIGIDITHLAIALIKHRLQSAFGERVKYRVIGEPVSVPDAEALAKSDPYQFQWWALGLVGARPVEQKKGADKGIDGRLYFRDDPKTTKFKQIIFSVKAGHTNVAHVRDLRGVIEREKAEIGVLITSQEPTQAMRAEAASGGVYVAEAYAAQLGTYPRVQMYTVADLLAGRQIAYPYTRYTNVTLRSAPAVPEQEEDNQTDLGF